MTDNVTPNRDDRNGRYWPLLFPLTYLIHIAEEYWAGPGFPEWSAPRLFRILVAIGIALHGVVILLALAP